MALLLAAPAKAGETITTPQASVTNPAGSTTSFISITGTSITGAVTNAGTITPGTAVGPMGTTVVLFVNKSTIGGGIANTGTIVGAAKQAGIAIDLVGSTVAGGIANSSAITVNGVTLAEGISVSGQSPISGDITNSGLISATTSGSALNPAVDGIIVTGSTVSGGIANSGAIGVTGTKHVRGINVEGSAFAHGIANSGMISLNSANSATGIFLGGASVAGGVTNSGAISGNGREVGGIGLNGSTVSGGIVNAGTINNIGGAVSIVPVPGLTAGGIVVAASTVSGGIANTGTIRTSGGTFGRGIQVFGGGTVSGGISNSGLIAIDTPGGNAAGISVGIIANLILGSTVTGGITNSGTITATGKTGNGVQSASPIGGGIANTGTISGSTSAIDLSLETGGSTVVNQAGGALIGAVKLSAIADVLSFTGGTISGAVTGLAGNQDVVAISGQGAVFTPTASVSVVSAFTQGAGSRLTLQVTPAQAPSISAGAISLGGTLNIALLGNLAGFGTGKTYKDVFASGSQIAGSFASVTTTVPIFTASVTPDAVTANALDVNLALSQTELAASAQDLTQSSQLGLDAPRVLTQAVQDRLVTNGGALGESAAANAGQKGIAGFSLGNANVWARGYDQFGSASGTGAAPGYDINRAAPFIAGIDWRFDNNIVAGVAATYVATSASFKDGSHTNVDSYQGGAYVGFGALSVNAADSNSFQTTLGVRLTSRIQMENMGTLTPELRFGWSHEFLDASQSLTAALVGVPGSTFSVTGIAFGRDTALIGGGFSMELSPDAKVFVDYDGKLGSHLQEHSISGGLRVRF